MHNGTGLSIVSACLPDCVTNMWIMLSTRTGGDNDVSRRNHLLTPDISLGYSFCDDASVSISYKMSTEKPPYPQLTGSLNYVGIHEIEGGNPALRDGRMHNLQVFRDVERIHSSGVFHAKHRHLCFRKGAVSGSDFAAYDASGQYRRLSLEPFPCPEQAGREVDAEFHGRSLSPMAGGRGRQARPSHFFILSRQCGGIAVRNAFVCKCTRSDKWRYAYKPVRDKYGLPLTLP